MKVADKQALFLVIDILANKKGNYYQINNASIDEWLSDDEKKILWAGQPWADKNRINNVKTISLYREKIINMLDSLRLNFGCDVRLNLKTYFIEANYQEVGMGLLATENYLFIMECIQNISEFDTIQDIFINNNSASQILHEDEYSSVDYVLQLKTADILFLQRTSCCISFPSIEKLQQKLDEYIKAYEDKTLESLVCYDENKHTTRFNKIIKSKVKDQFLDTNFFEFKISEFYKNLPNPDNYNFTEFMLVLKNKRKLDIESCNIIFQTNSLKIVDIIFRVEIIEELKPKEIQTNNKYNDDFIHFEMLLQSRINKVIYKSTVIELKTKELWVIYLLFQSGSAYEDLIDTKKTLLEHYKGKGSLKQIISSINKAFRLQGIENFIKSDGKSDDLIYMISDMYIDKIKTERIYKKIY